MTSRSFRLLAAGLLLPAAVVGTPGVAGARDAMVTFKVTVPASTPTDAKLYIAGDIDVLGPWDPGKVELGRIGDGLYAITLVLPAGSTIKYKFTRGTWESVEKGPNFEEISDRVLSIVGDELIPIAIDNWRDFSVERGRHTITGEFDLHLDFPATKLGNTRTIIVYLPPGYENEPGDVRHPVLYMHDGQNLFDAHSSSIGVEWNVDETVTRMVEAGKIEPVIVVGIYNTSDRAFEYTPEPDPSRGGGGARLYADFIVNEVKPFIDENYRTLPGKAHTGVVGSSLGGIVSIYLAWSHPDVFSKVGAMSTAYQWADGHIVRYLEDRLPPTGVTVWLDMGTAEGSSDANRDGVPDIMEYHRQVRDILMEGGLELGRTLRYVEDEGAVHNERAWASRFPQVVEFLFPAR